MQMTTRQRPQGPRGTDRAPWGRPALLPLLLLLLAPRGSQAGPAPGPPARAARLGQEGTALVARAPATAGRLLTEAFRLAPTPRLLYELGRAAAGQGRITAAQ